MVAKCTADLKNPAKAKLGFGMFYRLLTRIHLAAGALTPLPRVGREPRVRLSSETDEKGLADLH
jgi:hypothetical protein